MSWAPDYLTTAQMRAYLRIPHTDSDDEIAAAVAAASRAVDRHAGRQFGQVDSAEERYYTARWDRHRNAPRWLVPVDDLMTTTGLVVSCTAGTITDYTLEPRNAAAKGRPWEVLVINATSAIQPSDVEGDVAVTALWGWSAVPDAVTLATRIQASRFFNRAFSPYGIAGSPDQGSEMRLLERLDPDVGTSLSAYRRWWAAR